ncbi:hypothetical protein [Hyphomicrobium sp. 2TAF46]|uniref:hypothetical protein n=1 Tax=Hyphomicrobium sp. 2TAF46 TaxID=3233019 RepID=UPI003F8DECA4
MTRGRRPSFSIDIPHPLEAEVRKLKSQLWRARTVIISLMPEQYAKPLRSYHECTSTKEFWRWRESVAELIVTLVPADAIKEDWGGSPRANCPLCGSETSGPYPGGFAIPRGLIQHLTGHGNASHCSVTEAAFDLARESLESRFGEAERIAEKAAKEEDARQREERQKIETLYKLHPVEPPQLIDDGYHSWFGELRKVESLEWAEARAKTLGFQKHLDTNVMSLEKQEANYVIYADIRSEKRITFNIYRLPITKGKKVWKAHFDLPDYFRNDIAGKFDERLKEALQRFSR